MTNLKEIEKVVEEFNGDIEKIEKALRSIQSKKCNLAKTPFKPNYDKLMTEVLQREQMLKQAKNLLKPKEKFVTDFDQEDVSRLDYEETMKAIKSIQSKKFHTRWLTPVEGDNDEFRKACEIEEMLLNHKNNIKPIEDTTVRKTDLVTIIDTIKSSGNLSTERVVELLESLL